MSEITKGKWEISGQIGSGSPVYIKAGEKYIASVHTLEDGLNNKARLKEAKANALLIADAPDLLTAGKDFLAGWQHFCKCIDFGKSYLDAEAIRFMNEVPGKIEQAVKKAQG